MEDCVFCKIINKEIPAHIVYEDNNCLVFADKNPVNPGHLLVIPKNHKEWFYQVDDQEFIELMKIVKKFSNIVQDVFKPVTTGLVIAGWEVPHTHVHIIPMHQEDDITSQAIINGTRGKPSDEELEKIANKIKEQA